MIKLIKKILKRALKSMANKNPYFGDTYECSVCQAKLNTFLALPEKYQINAEREGYKYFGQNEHLNVEQYSCPICFSADRDRLYANYFLQFELDSNHKKSLLHVAPAWKLNDLFLKKHFKVTTTDLMMEGVDYYLDIENMHAFEDNSFDFFICSHVLEHVNSPENALKELYRILKPGGKGIIMAPIIPALNETLEDPSHTSEKDRLKHYGQEDHLRLFAKQDFMTRIENANFKLITLGENDFNLNTFERAGINPTAILYIGEKVITYN